MKDLSETKTISLSTEVSETTVNIRGKQTEREEFRTLQLEAQHQKL